MGIPSRLTLIDLHDDPAVLGIAAILSIEEDIVVGKLLRLWRWANRHVLPGSTTVTLPAQLVALVARNIAQPSATVTLGCALDHHVGLPGFAGALEKMGWLVTSPEGVSFPHFELMDLQNERRNALAARRMRRIRERKKAEKTAAPTAEAGKAPANDSATCCAPVAPRVRARAGARELCVCVEDSLPEKNSPERPSGVSPEEKNYTHTRMGGCGGEGRPSIAALAGKAAEVPKRAPAKPLAEDPFVHRVLRFHRARDTGKTLFDQCDPSLKDRQADDALAKLCRDAGIGGLIDEVIDEMNRILDKNWHDCGSFSGAVSSRYSKQAVKNVRRQQSRETARTEAKAARSQEASLEGAQKARERANQLAWEALPLQRRDEITVKIRGIFGPDVHESFVLAECFAEAGRLQKGLSR